MALAEWLAFTELRTDFEDRKRWLWSWWRQTSVSEQWLLGSSSGSHADRVCAKILRLWTSSAARRMWRFEAFFAVRQFESSPAQSFTASDSACCSDRKVLEYDSVVYLASVSVSWRWFIRANEFRRVCGIEEEYGVGNFVLLELYDLRELRSECNVWAVSC